VSDVIIGFGLGFFGPHHWLDCGDRAGHFAWSRSPELKL